MERKPGNQQNRNATVQADTGPSKGGTASTRAKSISEGSDKTASEKGGSDDLVQQAKETTTAVVGQVQQKASSTLNQQKDNAATDLKKVADAVRQMGDGLTGGEQGPVAYYAAEYGKKAADNIERLTDYLHANDARKLVGEVEKFGKRKPALFIGAAFLLGFAGARFLKSSAHNEEANASTASLRAPTTSAPAF